MFYEVEEMFRTAFHTIITTAVNNFVILSLAVVRKNSEQFVLQIHIVLILKKIMLI